jgi:hypothetical protein
MYKALVYGPGLYRMLELQPRHRRPEHILIRTRAPVHFHCAMGSASTQKNNTDREEQTKSNKIITIIAAPTLYIELPFSVHILKIL